MSGIVRGFSLIECIVYSSLLSFIALLIMPSFLQLFRILNSFECRAMEHACLYAAVDLLYRDVTNFAVDTSPLSCNNESIIFYNNLSGKHIRWTIRDQSLYRVEGKYATNMQEWSDTVESLVCRNIIKGSFFIDQLRTLTIRLSTKQSHIERMIFL